MVNTTSNFFKTKQMSLNPSKYVALIVESNPHRKKAFVNTNKQMTVDNQPLASISPTRGGLGLFYFAWKIPSILLDRISRIKALNDPLVTAALSTEFMEKSMERLGISIQQVG